MYLNNIMALVLLFVCYVYELLFILLSFKEFVFRNPIFR